MPGDSGIRHHALQGIITRGTWFSCQLWAGLILLLFLFGEIQAQSWTDFSGWHIVLNSPSDYFLRWFFGILAWDIFWLGVFLAVHRSVFTQTSLHAENVFTLFAVLFFWRLVWQNFLTIWSPEQAKIAFFAGSPEILLGTTLLILFVKESLFRLFSEADRLWNSPFMQVMAWHHRKDGVFTLFASLAIFGGSNDWPRMGFEQVFAAAKVLLLGTAAFTITQRCFLNRKLVK